MTREDNSWGLASGTSAGTVGGREVAFERSQITGSVTEFVGKLPVEEKVTRKILC